MRILAASPFNDATKQEILAFLSKATASLVLLPGWSEHNTPTPASVQRALRPGVAVFVESSGQKKERTPYLVTQSDAVPMPRQIFSSRPRARNLDALVEAMRERTFTIGSRQVTFLICGEIIAFNSDGSVKHGRRLNFDILLNPCHTLMGHWNYLGSKLSACSSRSLAIYATNNNAKHPQHVNTDVRIYRRGKHLNHRYIDGNIARCECEV